MASILLTAMVSILLSSLVATTLCRRSARRLSARFDQRLAVQRAEDAAIHLVERESMVAATEQLTQAGYGYVERLRSEIVRLEKRYADGQLAHDAEVDELRNEMATLRDELARSGAPTDGRSLSR